jgi:hypothetical protein
MNSMGVASVSAAAESVVSGCSRALQDAKTMLVTIRAACMPGLICWNHAHAMFASHGSFSKMSESAPVPTDSPPTEAESGLDRNQTSR